MRERARAAEVTFPIAAVEPASRPLAVTSARQAIEALLTAERLTKGRGYRPLEAWSHRGADFVAGIDHHPLVAALRLAYAGHRPIALSPDMIWLLICQGVAQHIEVHGEELRSRFVEHPGRLTLEVPVREVGRFRKGSPDNPWPKVFEDLSKQLGEQIGPRHELFLPDFSTTGSTERIAAEIVLMGAMRRYFHYLLTTFVCGIPTIHLEGTTTDWQTIVGRVDGFADLGLQWWLGPLHPVLSQFASAAAGNVDPEFWRSIYRIFDPEGCRADSALGWIGLFFPYLTPKRSSSARPNPWLVGERSLDELLGPVPASPQPSSQAVETDLLQDESGFLFDEDFPSGLSVAPFTWEERELDGHLVHRWDMELLSGFLGVTQSRETRCLRPEIGWVVREGPAA